MAAKRLGSFLSNVTGTAGQILRVKSDESGFEMFTPAGLPTYTITNDTTDRVIDADATTIDELTDVVSTLIKDITTLVGGPVAFQWSTSEQVYPVEKDSSGRTLYCKEVDFGALPNTGSKNVAHNISGYTASKVHKVWGIGYNDSNGDTLTLPTARPDNYVYSINLAGGNTNIGILTGNDRSAYSAKVRIIYAK